MSNCRRLSHIHGSSSIFTDHGCTPWRFDLYQATVYVTYYVDTSTVDIDARYELHIYSAGMDLLGQMTLARRESRPDWIDGRNAGDERTLSAEIDREQGQVRVMQWDLRAITYLDECSEDGCPDPTVAVETPSAVLTMDGSIRAR